MVNFTESINFHFSNPMLPTQKRLYEAFNRLGYHSSLREKADFSDDNLTLDLNKTKHLEYKDKLSKLLSNADFYPETYAVDNLNYKSILENKLSHRFDKPWIVKPAQLNNGMGIQIFTQISQVESYFTSNKRYNGPHIIQRYITPPDLIERRKYSLRLFTILTNFAGAYYYPNGYINFCYADFKANGFNQLNAHLTNEHLSNTNKRKQQPTNEWAKFQHVEPDIKSIIETVIKRFEDKTGLLYETCDQKAFAIFGFDFMLDKENNVWLLEVNHSPCFPFSEFHPLSQVLYDPFFDLLSQFFVVAIAKDQPIKTVDLPEPLEKIL